MKISTETVHSLVISGVERLDPIRVMWTDYGPGQGRITITCWDGAWSNYWGSMGPGWNMATFFMKASVDYLAGKLKNGLPEQITDEEALEQGCRAEVIRMRREKDLTKVQAQRLWEQIKWADFDQPWQANADVLEAVFGDDWYHSLPKRENPQYAHLCCIVRSVKEGLRLHTETEAVA